MKKKYYLRSESLEWGNWRSWLRLTYRTSLFSLTGVCRRCGGAISRLQKVGKKAVHFENFKTSPFEMTRVFQTVSKSSRYGWSEGARGTGKNTRSFSAFPSLLFSCACFEGERELRTYECCADFPSVLPGRVSFLMLSCNFRPQRVQVETCL